MMNNYTNNKVLIKLQGKYQLKFEIIVTVGLSLGIVRHATLTQNTLAHNLQSFNTF